MKNLARIFLFIIAFQLLGWSSGIVYPDKKLTPGKANPQLTKAVICGENFRTGDWRSVNLATKKKIFQAYKIPWSKRSQYEVDHLIALTDGGSNDVENLWPQPYDPRPGAHEKDILEYWLNRQVCLGRMNLAQAQKILTGNWYEKYLEMQRTKKTKK